MKSDDLAPLFAGQDKPDVGFHQGRVMSWNLGSSENTISMAGAVLSNVPVLNGTEPLLLKEGDVVGMLRFKTSYFVLGRIIVPGQTELGSLPGLQQGVGATETSFSLSSDSVNVASAVFQVPEWANQALVMCNAHATVNNVEATPRFVYLAATVSGGYGGEMYTDIAAGGYGNLGASTQYLMGAESYDVGLDGPVGLGSQITVAARMRSGGDTGSSVFNIASVHATVTFRRV